jgi:hypothetical protein
MAAAVTQRYADRLSNAVTRSANENADDAIAAYRSTLKAALDQDELMCPGKWAGPTGEPACPPLAETII